jgi:hypothetical protein
MFERLEFVIVALCRVKKGIIWQIEKGFIYAEISSPTESWQ